MKKPLTENIWLMGALTMLPIVGGFAGYRYWMRKRAKKFWLQLLPEDLYYEILKIDPPEDKVFTPEEHDQMATMLALKDAPFWRLNYVSAANHPSSQLQAALPLLDTIPPETDEEEYSETEESEESEEEE